jgi:glycosyltransferase involved in cell wall biosynthesis
MNRYHNSKIYVSLPAINELEFIHNCIDSIANQSFKNFKVFVCVNQPDDWWEDIDKQEICVNNQNTIKYLSSISEQQIELIDKSSKGKGWIGKNHGVGWARKTIMDEIVLEAEDNDIIISLDADTTFGPEYFASVIKNFQKNNDAVAMSVPYYHKLTGVEDVDRSILRYEIYMRNYSINMWNIGSPFNYTALGSAIATPVWAFKAIGRMTPKMSGEDFYFLQKLRKFGRILLWNSEKVFPAARFSDRVYFGTGPAMIKGSSGDWESYPIYHYSLFNKVDATYQLFLSLYKADCETSMTSFLKSVFKTDDLWNPLRENYKNEEQFIRACHSKVDGLRILQFLKEEQKEIIISDEECLKENLYFYFGVNISEAINQVLNNIDFTLTTIDKLDIIRNFLVQEEEKFQKL